MYCRYCFICPHAKEKVLFFCDIGELTMIDDTGYCCIVQPPPHHSTKANHNTAVHKHSDSLQYALSFLYQKKLQHGKYLPVHEQKVKLCKIQYNILNILRIVMGTAETTQQHHQFPVLCVTTCHAISIWLIKSISHKALIIALSKIF